MIQIVILDKKSKFNDKQHILLPKFDTNYSKIMVQINKNAYRINE